MTALLPVCWWLVACRPVVPTEPALPALDAVVAPGVEAGPLPTVVAIHGLGDRPESLVSLVQACGLPVRVVAPRGPKRHHDGFSWFDVRFASAGATFDATEIGAAADRIAALIGAHAADGVGDPIVTGFSQGGVLSFAVAVRHPDQVRLAIPIAGGLPDTLRPAGRAPAGAPPIRAVHGEVDRVLPIAAARDAVEQLQAQGWDATLTAFDGTDHTVSDDELVRVCAEIAAAP